MPYKVNLKKQNPSDKKFRFIFEGSLDVILIVDDTMKIADVNSAGVEFLAMPKQKLLNRRLEDFISSEQQLNFRKYWTSLQKKSVLRGTVEMITANGRKYFMEFNSNAQFIPGQTLFILRDITKRVEEEKRRENLLGIASHELRTPISTIKIFVDLIRRKLKGIKRNGLTEYLDKIDEKTNSTTQLLNDLLDISVIEEGKLVFNWEMFDVNVYFKKLINDLQLTINSHKLIFAGNIETEIIGDKVRLNQILTNLVRNAVKYSPGADKIMIRIRSVPDHSKFEMTVQDFGIGIKKNETGKIFDLFYQVQFANKKNRRSLGLGLHICKQLVKKMGGRIWVKSVIGKGSIFGVELPVKPKAYA
jgi:PAS domain S-box-containing protein